MTTREKVNSLKDNGISASHIARLVKCSPSTIINWAKGQTELSARLEEDVNIAIKELAERIGRIMEEE